MSISYTLGNAMDGTALLFLLSVCFLERRLV